MSLFGKKQYFSYIWQIFLLNLDIFFIKFSEKKDYTLCYFASQVNALYIYVCVCTTKQDGNIEKENHFLSQAFKYQNGCGTICANLKPLLPVTILDSTSSQRQNTKSSNANQPQITHAPWEINQTLTFG